MTPPDDHNRDIGRLEANVEALFRTVRRIEAKLDHVVDGHDGRIRDLEGEMKAIRRIGTVMAVLWGSIVAGISWLFKQPS